MRDRRLAIVALAAFALRLVLMLARGDYIVYDEGYYLLLERSLRAGHGFALNGLPHVALSPLQPVLVAALALLGVPDLWASRLLAVVCSALLVFPVATLAERVGGTKVALPAAALTAVTPALMSFVPFFPGRSWNLYFGSEPLFLLLAFGAVAAAMRAEERRWAWWAVAGALAGASYLTRAEGLVLCAALLAVAAARLLARRAPAADWRRPLLAAAAGTIVAAPYLVYLHSTLGRWALTGRVQAAASAGAAVPSAVASARSGGEALEAFVWQGEPESFLRALYGLDASGTGMASQYWGVRPSAAGPGAVPSAAPAPSDTSVPRSKAPARRAGAGAPPRQAPAIWWRGVTAVVPWWLGAIALAGLLLTRGVGLWWVLPLGVCATLPSLLTYVEPRSLLPLAPLAAIYAAASAARAGDALRRRWPRVPAVAPVAAVALALIWPAVRDLAQAWRQTTPLQQVATARRGVGEYLAGHLPSDAIVMSWHPAIALWADRPWRVLPYDSFERIAAYARSEQAAVVVFSRFEPSPIQRPPRAFTAVLPGTGSTSGSVVKLQPVDETPLLFVGRIAPAGGTP